MSASELARKLGIRNGHRLFVRPECADLLAAIRPSMPETVTVLPPGERPTHVDVVILQPAREELATLFKDAGRWIVPNGSVWAVVKRKQYRQATDVSFEEVQAAALLTDFVDNKDCSVSGTEYATRYVIRKERRPKA